MTNKEKFLKRIFIYDLQCLVAFLMALFLWVFVINIIEMDDDQGVNTLFLFFGLYNLFTYIWSKKMADKCGIELFGDLDQKSKIFGEIYSKHLHFRKLGAKSLFITVPLSFLPWPKVSFIVEIIMMAVYMIYRNVYFDNAMANRWPRVYSSGMIISRILGQDSDFGKKNNEEEKNGK